MNSDIGIQMATLTFINHMLNALSFEKDDGAAGISNTINGNNNSATPNIVVINEPSNNAKSQPTELEDFMDMLCDSIGILYILEVLSAKYLLIWLLLTLKNRNKLKLKV